ncbi:MAG TPA: site-specific integrase [Pseudosphingobacterium sp.]|nr:site-specific integrase [Pseudosphingobacterium sp.]
MLEKSYGLLFFLKQPKDVKRKERYVYLRITVDGLAKEFSTKEKWHVDRWDQKTGRASGNKEDARRLNIFLEEISGKVLAAKTELLRDDKPVTAQNLLAIVAGTEEKRKMVLVEFKNHNEKMEELLNKGYAQGTIDRFKTCYSHIATFIKYKYNEDDIPLSRLDYEFVSGLWHWFRTAKKCGNNTTYKYLTNFKKIIIHAQKMGWIRRDPFATFQMSKRPVKVEFLTDSELQTIEQKIFDFERLQLVKDIFVFSCYTGLAYVDAKNLKRYNITKKLDGEYWIKIERHKTGSTSSLPILPVALSIIEKYKIHPKCEKEGFVLPILSNQKMNAYLKEIADVCQINKKLTFHTARHTFATTVTLTNGIPIETVSSMLGHSSLKQTQHYARIVDKKKSDEMKLLAQKMPAAPILSTISQSA